MSGSRRKPIVWTWPIVPGYMAPKGTVENEDTEEMESGDDIAVQESPISPEAAAVHEEEEVQAQVSSDHDEDPGAAAEERMPPTAPGYPKIQAPQLDNGPGYDPEGECHFELEKMQLARAYVPWQRYGATYSPREALEKGTLFPDLYSPYPY